MNTFYLRTLFFSISMLLVVEDFQYLFKMEPFKADQQENAFNGFHDDGGKEEGKESKKDESGSEEFKKKDENNNVTTVELLTFYTLAIKNILSHACCHFSDVVREMETPPPEV